MATNPDNIVAKANEHFNRLIEFSKNHDPDRNLLQLETGVFEQILEIGRLAMEAHLAVQSARFEDAMVTTPNGVKLPCHSEREATIATIFGGVRFSRTYYYEDRLGHFEMDAALNIPPTGPSDFLRMLVERLANSMSYEEASALLADYFPVSKSTRSVKELFETDSRAAQDYYEQAPKAIVCEEETILVVQADGKGVPVVTKEAPVVTGTKAIKDIPGKKLRQAGAPGGNKSGPKREGKKKMATVAAVATYAPLPRTAEEIVASLFDEKNYIPAPKGHSFKRVWATMQGKDAAIAQSQTFVDQIATTDHIEHRLLLTDGEKALKNRLQAAYPGYTHILDLIHALSYLWLAAGAWFGSGTAKEEAWVRGATLRLLRGEANAVIEEIFDWAEAVKSASKIDALEMAGWYLHNNLKSMRYDVYLANGWPIATGMVEGACRHIVKDRCERSGQRWTQIGVEGMLRLRCIEENGDWESYHAYRILQRHAHVYGRQPVPPVDDMKADVYHFRTEAKWATAA